MNNTVTGLSKTIPKNLTDLFSSLCGEVCLIREQWQMYETLYGQEANCNLLNKSAPMFFWMVDYLFIDNFILALCRLGDSAEQRIRTDIVKNFTFRQLLSQLEQEPKSHASLIQSLTPLLADYQTKCEALRAQRNKRVSHTDYDTKMAPNKNPLPDVSRDTIECAIVAAEDFVNRVESHFSGTDPCLLRNVLSQDTAHTLLDRLYKAVAYDKLHDEGKIEVGYAHKLFRSLRAGSEHKKGESC